MEDTGRSTYGGNWNNFSLGKEEEMGENGMI